MSAFRYIRILSDAARSDLYRGCHNEKHERQDSSVKLSNRETYYLDKRT